MFDFVVFPSAFDSTSWLCCVFLQVLNWVLMTCFFSNSRSGDPSALEWHETCCFLYNYISNYRQEVSKHLELQSIHPLQQKTTTTKLFQLSEKHWWWKQTIIIAVTLPGSSTTRWPPTSSISRVITPFTGVISYNPIYPYLPVDFRALIGLMTHSICNAPRFSGPMLRKPADSSRWCNLAAHYLQLRCQLFLGE